MEKNGVLSRASPVAELHWEIVKSITTIAIVVCLSALCACGSGEEQERQRIAREAALKRAVEDSLAEEREKDRRMFEAASSDASQRIARAESERDQGLAKASAADAAAAQIRAAEEQKLAADAEFLRRYTDKLKASIADPDSLQLRYAEVSPRRNGMCALFNTRDKAGRVLGYKRVVVTDARVATEEAPTRETMSLYLLFQLAARDTGCFPDVQQVKILQ